MKYKLYDKVRTRNMDGQYNNALGKVVNVITDADIEPVYMVAYDVPFGSCTKGMYKESDLIKDGLKQFVITYAMTGGKTIEAETEEQAREIFDNIPEFELYEDATPAEITEVFEEVG